MSDRLFYFLVVALTCIGFQILTAIRLLQRIAAALGA